MSRRARPAVDSVCRRSCARAPFAASVTISGRRRHLAPDGSGEGCRRSRRQPRPSRQLRVRARRRCVRERTPSTADASCERARRLRERRSTAASARRRRPSGADASRVGVRRARRRVGGARLGDRRRERRAAPAQWRVQADAIAGLGGDPSDDGSPARARGAVSSIQAHGESLGGAVVTSVRGDAASGQPEGRAQNSNAGANGGDAMRVDAVSGATLGPADTRVRPRSRSDGVANGSLTTPGRAAQRSASSATVDSSSAQLVVRGQRGRRLRRRPAQASSAAMRATASAVGDVTGSERRGGSRRVPAGRNGGVGAGATGALAPAGPPVRPQ